MKRGNIRKFGREFQQREALTRSLLNALIMNGQIKTTLPKAKSLKPQVDKLITRAKLGTIQSRRLLAKTISNQALIKLTTTITPKMSTRNSGYTRITQTGRRLSDGAPLAVIRFII